MGAEDTGKRRVLRSATAIAAVVLCLLIGSNWIGGESRQVPTPAEPLRVTTVEQSGRVGVPSAVDSQVRVAISSAEAAPARIRAHILVTDEGGAPVSGALVCRSPTPRRLNESDAQVLGKTGGDGRVQLLDLDSIEAVRFVVAEGFLPGELIEPLERDEQRVVVLIEGYRQVVECVDVRGSALAGCTVVASRQSLSLTQMTVGASAAGIPGPGPSALFQGVSDDDGRVVLTGLAGARHRYTVTKPGMVAIRAGSPIAFEPSDVPLRVVLAPIYVFAFSADAERVDSHSYRFDGGWIAANLPNPVLEHERAQIHGRFPEAYVAVAALTDGDAAPLSTLRLLLASGDRHEESVRGTLWGTFQAPESLVLPDSHRSVADESRLWFFDADGREHSPLGLSVTVGESFFDGFVVAADSDGRLRVASGRYALSHGDLLLAGGLTPAELSAPGDVVVTASVGLRRCRLEARTDDGELSSEAVWTLSALGRTATIQALAGSRIERLLPIGALTIRVQCFGRPVVEKTVEVTSGEPREIQAISVDL
ncbi:MAG: hypothetical protein FJ298_04485 [Planctomycetes bacterium]|nr:hypothetical protein [Planctomycetota bacterium]